MAYIDCDKCYHGRVCAHRHHYHDMIVECNHHIPTADVVEVVRCKDCKCCELCYPAKAIGEEALEGWYCKIRRKHMQPDDFCSYGEKKGENDVKRNAEKL